MNSARERRGVVVGGGSGIGRATCHMLAAAGCRLLVADKNSEASASVAREASMADQAAGSFGCDIRNLDEVEALCNHAENILGTIDFLVVTSGITQGGGIVEADAGKWRQLLETNVLGVAHCLRVFLPSLARADAGQAVLLASLSGREAYAGQPVYIASKFGEIGLVHSVRKEAQKLGVRVSLIEPGLVDTPMSRSNPFAQPIFAKTEPLTPNDVARAIVYVLDQPSNVLVLEVALQPVFQNIAK
jgi:NADP-dependent 3-hydroxy acid dehydrogenase YdfG